MAYGNRYYLDYYDHYNDLIKVYILQDGYTGAVTDLTGSDSPFTIHWLGEGTDKMDVIKGSTAQLRVMSTTDRQFLSLFTSTSRKYMISAWKNSDQLWQGFVDADSYREPFTCPPYVSVIHASDGLGELKNTTFPTPEETDLHALILPLKYYITQCLRATGHSLPTYVACNLSFTGGTNTPFEDIYIPHTSFQDEDNNYISCYDILEKILKSLGARVYMHGGKWWVDRVDYIRNGTVDYDEYSYAGAYMRTLTSNARSLTLTGADGATPCVFVNNSQQMEIVPAWKSFILKTDAGEKMNILTCANAMGKFVESEFEEPPAAGPWPARYWSPGNNPGGNGSTLSYGYTPGNDYLQISNINYPYPAPIVHQWPYLESDVITLDNQGVDTNGEMRLRLDIKASFGTTNNNIWLYSPYVRFNIKVAIDDSDYFGSDPYNQNIGYVGSSPGNTLRLYLKEVDNKLIWTQQEDFSVGQTTTPWTMPYLCGRNLCKFSTNNTEADFSVQTEPLKFAFGHDVQPRVQVRLYALTVDYSFEGGSIPVQPYTFYLYYLKIYHCRLRLIDSMVPFDRSGEITVDLNNRFKPSEQVYEFSGGTSTFNQRFYNKYVFVKSDGTHIGPTWEIDGDVIGALVLGVNSQSLLSQFNRPMRKLSGEILSQDIWPGSLLVDPYGAKYLFTGVEYDTRLSRWNGEWIQIYDPSNPDSGDYDADDFSQSDFWAI